VSDSSDAGSLTSFDGDLAGFTDLVVLRVVGEILRCDDFGGDGTVAAVTSSSESSTMTFLFFLAGSVDLTFELIALSFPSSSWITFL
jgi:hypothetical protein